MKGKYFAKFDTLEFRKVSKFFKKPHIVIGGIVYLPVYSKSDAFNTATTFNLTLWGIVDGEKTLSEL